MTQEALIDFICQKKTLAISILIALGLGIPLGAHFLTKAHRANNTLDDLVSSAPECFDSTDDDSPLFCIPDSDDLCQAICAEFLKTGQAEHRYIIDTLLATLLSPIGVFLLTCFAGFVHFKCKGPSTAAENRPLLPFAHYSDSDSDSSNGPDIEMPGTGYSLN
jgi:hypothetical protein